MEIKIEGFGNTKLDEFVETITAIGADTKLHFSHGAVTFTEEID